MKEAENIFTLGCLAGGYLFVAFIAWCITQEQDPPGPLMTPRAGLAFAILWPVIAAYYGVAFLWRLPRLLYSGALYLLMGVHDLLDLALGRKGP